MLSVPLGVYSPRLAALQALCPKGPGPRVPVQRKRDRQSPAKAGHLSYPVPASSFGTRPGFRGHGPRRCSSAQAVSGFRGPFPVRLIPFMYYLTSPRTAPMEIKIAPHGIAWSRRITTGSNGQLRPSCPLLLVGQFVVVYKQRSRRPVLPLIPVLYGRSEIRDRNRKLEIIDRK